MYTLFQWATSGPWLARLLKNIVVLCAMLTFIAGLVSVGHYLDKVLGYSIGFMLLIAVVVIGGGAIMASLHNDD